MKKCEIGIGRFYSNGKQVVCQVIDEGPQCKLISAARGDGWLRYRCLNSNILADIDVEANVSLPHFAAWAKQEIAAKDIHEHLARVRTKRMARKLAGQSRATIAAQLQPHKPASTDRASA